MFPMYHFTKTDTLRDGRLTPTTGEWLFHDGPIKMCESGLHASVSPIDALYYAPGCQLHQVELDGEIIQGTDKSVGSLRRIIASIDARNLLVEFATIYVNRADIKIPDPSDEYVSRIKDARQRLHILGNNASEEVTLGTIRLVRELAYPKKFTREKTEVRILRGIFHGMVTEAFEKRLLREIVDTAIERMVQ